MVVASRLAQQRLARARQVLREAEQRAGVRSAEQRELRRAASGAGLVPVACSVPDPTEQGLPGVWQALERDLDAGWSGVLSLSGSLWLLLSLAARRQAAYGWCAVVGGQDVGWCAAAEAGLDLERTVVVGALGALGAQGHSRSAVLPGVVAALIDGVEVVVLASGSAAGLSRGLRRSMQARARERGVLVLLQEPWEGGHQLRAHLSGCDTGEVVRAFPAQAAAHEMPAGYLRGMGWRVRDPRSGALAELSLDAQGLHAGTLGQGPESVGQGRPRLTVIEGGAL